MRVVIDTVEHGREEAALDRVNHIIAADRALDQPVEQIIVPQAGRRRRVGVGAHARVVGVPRREHAH